MQPKTPKPTYSIIFMRDDCNVSAFRLHSFWIKLFIALIIILIAACAAGIYGTIYYEDRYRVSTNERRELQRILGENKVRLEKLANEQLLGRFTGSTSSPGRNPGSNSVSPTANPVPAAPATPGSTASPSPEDLAKLLDQISPAQSAGADIPTDIEKQMAEHPVQISNLKINFEDEKRIRLRYDLRNQKEGITLIGRCSIALITRNGDTLDITPSARGVLSFQIARFRKMDILAQIPASVKKEDLVKVQISAKANEFPLYYTQFPIEK